MSVSGFFFQRCFAVILQPRTKHPGTLEEIGVLRRTLLNQLIFYPLKKLGDVVMWACFYCLPPLPPPLPPQAVLIVLKETWMYNVNTTPGAEGGRGEGKCLILTSCCVSGERVLTRVVVPVHLRNFSHETRPENHLSANSWRILFVFLFYRNWNG